ncbi:MAG: alpha/beta hydrolase [Treponema sp.]
MMDATYSLRQAKKLFKKYLYSLETPISAIRAEYDDVFYIPHIPNGVERERALIGDIPVEVLHPELAVSHKAVLYVHGGFFISGSVNASRNLCASIAHECKSNLFLPEYRLAPEYPFPAALDDIMALYTALLSTYNLSSTSIVCAGDGSGAAIITALIFRLKAEGLPLPAGLVLLSPWLDLSCSQEEISALQKKDLLLTKASLVTVAERYVSPEYLADPLVSPLFGSFADFPPVLIQCGGQEVLLADAKACAHKIEAAGGRVQLNVWETMPHFFQALYNQSEEALQAVAQIGSWVQSLFVT